MRIINVIGVEDGVVEFIESFPVYEEHLSDKVVEKAGKFYISAIKAKMKELQLPDIHEDFYNIFLQQGYWTAPPRKECSIGIVWSNTND